MKRILIVAISLIAFSITYSQTIRNSVKITDPIKTKVEDFKIKEVKDVYELGMSLAYINHLMSISKTEFLYMPLVVINNIPIDGKTLKNYKTDDIVQYEFLIGIKATALYGTRAQHGALIIKLAE